MRRACTLIVAAGTLAVIAAPARAYDDYDLIAQAAADRSGQAAPAEEIPARPPSDNLGEAERTARMEVALAQARLELVLGRKALKTSDHQAAALHAQRVLQLLKELPADVDASVYELQAEGILARARKAGVDVEALASQQRGELPAADTGDYLDRQTRAAAEIARRYTGADRDSIDTRGDVEALRQRTLRRQVPDDCGYRPGKEIIDVDAILEQDRQRLHYEAALQKAYSADEARLLVQADEARVVPAGDIAYPDDWPEKVARRAKYEGGMIARSKSWIDKEGREWYVAIYDIQDLIYVPPDFQPAFSLDIAEEQRNVLDREALRLRSGIFNSYYPEDIAAGIPLLRYFGGVDDYAYRGPKYSAARERQIVEMIKAFTTQLTESRIIPLDP